MTLFEASVEQAMEQLKANGYKYTTKRQRILSILAEKGRYVSAKELFNKLKIDFNGISYDTIYRNLDTLVSLSIVEATEFGNEKRFLFHPKRVHQAHHHHFICTICGNTKEIEICPISEMTADLDDCEIEGHKFEIYGKCPKCLKKINN
ncbi:MULTISPECIES: Fur family transcriptional regulator [unclassified Enterococcus]|uniref:Fur family transcriptional regulator n=1 Tax=unclassified Enterococcus TaxID=2608891 RepID=UPI001552DDBC|nr:MULTISPECIES: Fur family transcriptional regulator [unclassified Enterococcus]MBS7577409.1 transcriptional repressor [Enterococcus sp. MMGLQ5-2]MBS7584816.1 transcriptional repressor [Enterococcus sp. MMGLQ5-1]NPD12671.1 transcriptional repressor [Enterococcus sp. MMGLQ5-1]NPD37243.1 transcriptional repressor [Enterococcus sp. MMGLQ5-2]